VAWLLDLWYKIGIRKKQSMLFFVYFLFSFFLSLVLFYCILFISVYIWSLIWCRLENVRITDWEQTQFSTHEFTDKIEGFVHRVF
jgi:hypothetical protein